MLESSIAKKYQDGTLGKLPTIVDDQPAQEKKGTQWWGPVLVLISVAIFLWLVVPSFRKKRADQLAANQESLLPVKTSIQ